MRTCRFALMLTIAPRTECIVSEHHPIWTGPSANATKCVPECVKDVRLVFTWLAYFRESTATTALQPGSPLSANFEKMPIS